MREAEHDSILPGDPIVDRMWIVRAADWFSARRFAFALMIVGSAILTAALLRTVHAYSSPIQILFERKSENHYAADGESSDSSMFDHSNMVSPPEVLSVMIVIGAGLSCLATFWISKRFSLRRLLIAVFVIGALGAIPSRLPRPRAAFGSFAAGLTPAMSQDEIAAICKALQPSAALQTLPAGLRSALGTYNNTGIVKFKSSQSKFSDGSPDGVVCEIELGDDLPADERDTLLEFYEYYVNFLVFSVAEAKGVSLPRKANAITGDPHWEPWRKEWLAARK